MHLIKKQLIQFFRRHAHLNYDNAASGFDLFLNGRRPPKMPPLIWTLSTECRNGESKSPAWCGLLLQFRLSPRAKRERGPISDDLPGECEDRVIGGTTSRASGRVRLSICLPSLGISAITRPGH